MWLPTYLRNFTAIFQGNPRFCGICTFLVCTFLPYGQRPQCVYALDRETTVFVLMRHDYRSELRWGEFIYVCLKNVAFYGSTLSCTLVTVPLSFNFTCLELAARGMPTGRRPHVTCACLVVRPCGLLLSQWAQPPTAWYLNGEPCEALIQVVVCPTLWPS